MSPRRFGTVGVIAIGYFVLAVVALHFLEPGFRTTMEASRRESGTFAAGASYRGDVDDFEFDLDPEPTEASNDGRELRARHPGQPPRPLAWADRA